MAESAAPLLATLRAIVGEANVLTSDADVAPYLTDWRDRYHGRAQAVLRPATTAQVAAVVRCCAEHAVAVVPQGGNTGLCGGATPDEGGGEIVVSLLRLNRVRALDADNATITVEAGVPLARVQQAADEAGLLFPLSLASEGSCAIGGNLSTNAGGTAVLRYGNARELVLGLEVVLADGRVWDGLKGLRKDNTGYDLKQLFLGSEGTLGIITAAVLKLFPEPRTSATAWAAVADVEAAVALLSRPAPGARRPPHRVRARLARLRRTRPRQFPALPDPLPGHAWFVLVQADDAATHSPLAAQLEAALADAVGRALVRDAPSRNRRYKRRGCGRCANTSRKRSASRDPTSSTTSACPYRASPEFLRQAQRRLDIALPGVRYIVFGHLGDGNLHYNLSAPAGAHAAGFLDGQSRPIASSTIWWRSSGVASVPNTASGSSSATSSRVTRARSRST